MNLLEVAKHALEAMEDAMERADTHEFYDAKESLRYAIEQAEQAEQEPVAWIEGPHGVIRANPLYRIKAPQSVAWSIPLYTAPTPRKPLTDEEIMREKPACADFVSFRSGIRCMERIFLTRNMK